MPTAATSASIAEIAADVAPLLPVSISSEILPEFREYERTVTTADERLRRPGARDAICRTSGTGSIGERRAPTSRSYARTAG